MKNFRSKHTSIAKSRWAAYAAAGAATALAGTNSAEADIHYSGMLNRSFRPHRDGIHRLPLDQSGDFLVFQRHEVGTAFFQRTDIDYFRIKGIASAAFRGTGTYGGYNFYVSKLHSGQNISSGYFPHTFRSHFNYGGIMAQGPYPGDSPWRNRGPGYVGFRFDNGAGIQYGWVRVRMSGPPENAFKVVSYAYADPGEPIVAGQTSGGEIPDEGSLGWLAAGAVGLLAWRKSRSRTAR